MWQPEFLWFFTLFSVFSRESVSLFANFAVGLPYDTDTPSPT
jgi:hypothetical protein